MATTNPANLPGPPVAPSEAQGAQIPLQSFTLPAFPPAARALKALTLTSDIPVSSYHGELDKSFEVPDSIPTGIESLTLELFSLGYPAGFLSKLAERLPNLKSVVLYSQLFGGVSKESQEDAVEFFKRLPGLRALHLLDVFAKPGFFAGAAKWLKYNTDETPGHARRGLMFLEVNYTFRQEDEDFMAQIQASELANLIGPGLISCSFNVAAPEDEDGKAGRDGVMAFDKAVSAGLVRALADESGNEEYPRGLRALNTTLFTFSSEQLGKVLKVQKNVMVLNVTVEAEPGEKMKKELIKILEACVILEQVEIVANPSTQFLMEVQNPNSGVVAKTFPLVEDMDTLTKRCSKLASFKANILRTNTFGAVGWERKNGEWYSSTD